MTKCLQDLLATPILQEVKEMKERMEREVSQQLDTRELLLNQREAELTNLQVSSAGPLTRQGKIHSSQQCLSCSGSEYSVV